MRRRLVLLSPAFAFLAAHAQAAWPAKPVHIVVTFPPGGVPDTLARILAEKWAVLGEPVTVDNKPGAGGNLGADFVAKSPADGHTLLIGTVGTHAINAALYVKLPFDHVRDFTPIIFLGSLPNLLVVNRNLPARTLPELVELARKRPLSFGSTGTGTSSHLSGELFNTVAGVKMQHVPYKGRAQALPDLLGGRIDLMFDSVASALPLVNSGELRAIGITSDRRSPVAPGIPTLAESGLPAFQVTTWAALFAPAALPRDIQLRINAEATRVLALPDVAAKLSASGLTLHPGPPEELASLVRSETAKWAAIVKASGAKAD